MSKLSVIYIKTLSDDIKVVEKGCRARKMNAEFVNNAIERAETHLGTMLFKKDWKGIRVLIDEAGGERFPSCYNGVPESTQVIVAYSGRNWSVIDVSRSRVSKSEVLIENLDTKKDELVNFALQRKASA